MLGSHGSVVERDCPPDGGKYLWKFLKLIQLNADIRFFLARRRAEYRGTSGVLRGQIKGVFPPPQDRKIGASGFPLFVWILPGNLKTQSGASASFFSSHHASDCR